MSRKAIEITLTKEQREQLETVVRSQSAERRMVERAAIILTCASGKQNQLVALEHETSEMRVGKWRKRYAEHGIAGLEDERRPGKPETYGEAFRINYYPNWQQRHLKACLDGIVQPWQNN